MKKVLLSILSFVSIGFSYAQQPNGLISVYNLDSNTNDVIKNVNGIANTGVSFIQDRFGNPNQAIRLDGKTGFVNLGDDKKFEFTNEFTFSMWIDQDGKSILNVGNYPGSGVLFNREGEYQVAITEEGELIYAFSTTTKQSWAWVETGVTIDSTKWSHLAVTFGADSLNFYVDGIKKAGFKETGNFDEATSNTIVWDDLRLGGRQDTGGGKDQKFNGKMDDVKIFNQSLTESQISRLHNEENINYSSSLLATYQLSSNVHDKVNSLDGELIGGQYTEDRFGNASGAITLNGANDYIQLTDVKAFEFTNEFTFSMWIDQDGKSILNVGNYPGSGVLFNREGEYQVAITEEGELIYAFSTTTKQSWAWVETGVTIDSTKWSHLAVTFGADSLNFYVDGIKKAGFKETGNFDEATSNTIVWDDLRLGGRQDTGGGKDQKFNGKIDDVSIYSKSLSQGEIMSIYDKEKILSTFSFSKKEEILSIFPNPASNILTIGREFSTGIIMTLDGKKVKSFDSNQINVSELENGIYIIKVTDVSGDITTKFIKQ